MIRVLTTNAVTPSERFDYWYEETKRIGGFRFSASDLSGGTFHATIDASPMGDAALLAQSASAYGIEQRTSDNAHLREPSFLLVSHRAGVVHYTHEHERKATVTAGKGDLVLTDLTRPMRSTIEPGGLQSVSLVLPHGALVDALGGEPLAPNIKLGGPVAELISSYMRGLEPMAAEVLVAHGQTFANQVRELVVLALRGRPSERAEPALGTARMRAIAERIDFHLGDPELTPADVAAHVGISVRYLHMLFEQTGVTFSEYLMRRRLARCHDELSDPNTAGRSIADIALRWGFNSFSHFSRRFRAAYGVAPRDLRKGGRGAG